MTKYFVSLESEAARELCEKLGAVVPEELLQLALTHPSAVGEGLERTLKSNQRLEFLGDAILGAVIAEHLFVNEPMLPEGALTQHKAALVQQSTLSGAARRLELGRHLSLGRGEANSGGHERDTILSDALEALIGAIFLAHGFDKARNFVLRALHDDIEGEAGEVVNIKNRLQEWTQAHDLGTPQYQTALISQSSPQRRFSSDVLLINEVRGRGQGATKKEAECRAAQIALDALSNRSA